MRKKTAWATICTIFFLVLMTLVRIVDVQPIGPEGTNVGFAQINGFLAKTIGVHYFWYELTNFLGYVAILTCVLFGCVGLMQWIKRKKILKVDEEILALGVFYILVIGLYVIFEFVVINYQPVILPGEEHVSASFPSSHTMLICTVMGSVPFILKKYIQSFKVQRILSLVCISMIAVTVVGRFLSGAHWFTDILAGVLLSSALLLYFASYLENLKRRETK